jgi:thiol-disulfide isomerase/thioredoxin
MEDKFHEIPSIRIQVESKSHLTPRQVACLRANGGNPRPDSNGVAETIYDSKRIRHRYENDWQVALLEVWNGKQRKTYNFDKVQNRGRYSLSASFINGFSAYCPWLQLNTRRFWWSPLSPLTEIPARPDEYTLPGEVEYRGDRCYRCTCERAMRQLYFGVEDRRLHGLVQKAAPMADAELALQGQIAGRLIASKDEADAYVAALSPEAQHTFAERCNRQRFASPLPYDEIFFEDFREIAPGIAIPFTTTFHSFACESGETFLIHSNEHKVVAVEVNPRLSDDLFDIEIPEGATVVDQPDGLWPPLEYEYKKNFSDDEWKVIVASRKDDLANAHRDKMKLEQRIGERVPDFLPSAWRNSDPLTWSKDLHDKIVILEFTADWCGACRRQIPTLCEMHELRDRSGIPIVGVHAAGSATEAIDKFVADSHINYPLYVDVADTDRKDDLGQLFRWFQFDAIPHSVLIDRQGTVAAIGHLEDVLLKARELAKSEK